MSSVGVAKKSAFSCEPCRKRKVKCGGERPTCKRCATRTEACVYKLNPTLSYTQRLERRVQELEQQLAGIQSQGSYVRPVAPAPAHLRKPSDAVDDGLAGSFTGLKLDDKGVITYHGTTSFFQLPSENEMSATPSSSSQSPPAIGDADLDRRERLVTNAWQQRALEDLSATPEPFQYLLNIHWCWIQPLFNFIYRPAFTRDMQVLGPYYSHTLMNAVLSHSIRWGKSDPSTRQKLDEAYEGGAVFGRHARIMIFDELSHGITTIPTVQTLLLLSAQECSLGNSAQAYVYSGIAFRLIDHLGICVDGARYAASVNLSDEDIEIRNRLFWSCYFWDKIISLYLGRSPVLQHSPVSPPQIMFDDSSERDLWVPFGLDSKDFEYPPTAAHSNSCFTKMCQLSVIFNQILVHMYDPLRLNTEAEMEECLSTQGAALQQWWDELPQFLRIEKSSLPALAPPSHIVTLNCLYHTFKILLYRPMLSQRVAGGCDPRLTAPNARYLLECVNAATTTIVIFDLFCSTFGYGRCVLSLSYSVYIAASIFLLQVQANVNDNLSCQRLKFCIHALDRLKSVNPVIGSALSLISKELARLGIETPQSPQQNYVGSPSDPMIVPATNYPLTNEPAQLPRPPTRPYDQSQFSRLDEFGSQGFEITPELFEAVSTLEPLSVRVGALNDFKF
ncbi:nitrogen assimilation transcription factor nit-4 [Phialemonium atrogriseum]|uniref:Nitrogen assimilation transcription factor nit-4 n=1 Tax=Phialemonium atrogriseum TaxID=1093897 RepID=A0AAJ0FFU2_9PEZI|nr:nitrogen assimilation transcription factor nit-4 [Phialemonium atrogriseum]KAK1766916.1 nitrogen assimilation transcription factor nit-4 [Phialemonium atrogriseum]